MAYWLFKSEPQEFGIQHLAAQPEQSFAWDGVRNYQARNFLRDGVAEGDKVFIYHSSCKRIGIAGVADVTQAGHPDPSQFDPDSAYYDAKSQLDAPRWYQVKVRFVQQFDSVLPLSAIKQVEGLTELPLLRRGHRLSVMPVVAEEWARLLTLAARQSP